MKPPSIIGLKRPLTEDQKAVIDICKETLAQALEGDITSIAVVACMKTGYGSVMAGRQASDLYMGCGSLQRKILDAVENDGERLMNDVMGRA